MVRSKAAKIWEREGATVADGRLDLQLPETDGRETSGHRDPQESVRR